MTTARQTFLWIALLTFGLDQASKLYLFFVVDIALMQPIVLTSFFELILVWNRGISYGLLQQHSELGRWGLIIFSVLAAAGLSIWAWRANETVLASGLALIAGGAAGNAVDRVLYGAVLDFAHFHWGTFSWYVFNVADAAIVVGVVILLYDSFRNRGSDAPKTS
jgi:signal peptidase II